MRNRVTELTHGQGGVEWHMMRSTSGAITSTTASIIFRHCQDDIPEESRCLLEHLGIRKKSQMPEPSFTEEVLQEKTVPQLKEILRQKRLPIAGSKPILVNQILDAPLDQFDIRQELMKTWFLKPLKNYNCNNKLLMMRLHQKLSLIRQCHNIFFLVNLYTLIKGLSFNLSSSLHSFKFFRR